MISCYYAEDEKDDVDRPYKNDDYAEDEQDEFEDSEEKE